MFTWYVPRIIPQSHLFIPAYPITIPSQNSDSTPQPLAYLTCLNPVLHPKVQPHTATRQSKTEEPSYISNFNQIPSITNLANKLNM